MAFDPILPHDDEEQEQRRITELKWYAIKFTVVFAALIIILTVAKRLYPKAWIFKGYHPFFFLIAVYACTFLFGIVDNAIIIFDNNHLEDLLSHYLNDDMLAAIIINIFTAGISLYIGAGIQDLMGIALNREIDPTAEQFALGLLLGGGVVCGIYLIYKRFFATDSNQNPNQNPKI